MAQSENDRRDDTNIYLSYSLPRLITTPIKYSFTAYLWYLYIKEFGWTPSDYSELYWIYTLTQVISHLSLGYIFNLVIEDRGNSSECKLKTTKWIEMASIILLSVTFFLLILLPICWYILKLPVRTIIWNLLCRARTTARNYMTPYERYPFEKAERDKRIRIIRSMLPDLLNPLPRSSPDPNSELEQLLNLTPKPDHAVQPIQVIGTLPNPSIPFWPRFWHYLCIPFKIIWNLLCRARTTARNYLTPYEIYPAENAERQKRLRIIRSMLPELANPLPNAAPNPQPEPTTNPIPVINTLPKPSLLSRMRSLFKPKSKLRSPYEFPFSPVEFGGVPDLTATWTMVWYKSPDPLVPEVKYKPSLRERLNYFRNRGSYNVAKYDPPVPEMYIPPEPEPSPVSSTSKSTPTSPRPPIPPIKRDQPYEPVEQLPEPKSIPKPNQGPIPYITPGPAPVDSILEPKPIPELDSISEPKLNIDDIPYITPDPPPLRQGPIAEPIPKAMPPHAIEPEPPPLPPNIPLHNNRATKAYPNNPESPFRLIELVLRLIVSKRFILYMIIALHSIGTSSFDLCNKALTTYLYPGKISYDANENSRNNMNALSVGFFIGASFLTILLFSFVKNFARSKTSFTKTFFAISILSFLGQIPVLYLFHDKTKKDVKSEGTSTTNNNPQPCITDYLKLISLTTFHATTMFWIFMGGLLTNYVSPNTINGHVGIMAFVISISVIGFPVISWLHIGVATFISDTCGFLFNYGNGQIILVAACIVAQSAVCYLFDSHNYWWNLDSMLQFFILIIAGIANMIFLIHTYVMLDNALKKKTVNELKWIIFGIFYAVMSLVTYSAVYINFNSYDNNELIETNWNSSGWIYNYDFPTVYKLITFVFQLANVAAFAVYYIVYICDAFKKRLDEETKLKQRVQDANQTAHQANTIALSAHVTATDARGVAKDTETLAQIAYMTAEEAKKVAEKANRTANEAKTTANAAKRESSEAKKIAKEAQLTSAYALEVAIYALNVAAWAQNIATGALEFALTARNLALYALNFALSAIDVASYAQRDSSYAKTLAEDAQTDAKWALEMAKDAQSDATQAKIQASGARTDAAWAINLALSTQNLAADAMAYASWAKKYAEDAIRDVGFAKSDAELAKGIAITAKAIAEFAKSDAAWAKKHADSAQTIATTAQIQSTEAQTDASWAIRIASTALADSKVARDAASTAQDTAEKTQKDLEETKKKVTEAENKANQAQTTADEAKGTATNAQEEAKKAQNEAKEAKSEAKEAKETADEVKRALEASEKMGEAISKVERKKIRSLADGFTTSSSSFQKKSQEFDTAANEILSAHGINSKVQGVLTYFSQAANCFKQAVDTLTKANDGAAQKFLDFTNELQKNPTCNTPNTSLMPILYGLVTRVEKLQDAVNDFKNKADIFGDARTPTAKQFHTMATKFSRTSKAFNSFAQSLNNTAEYFVEFANALPQNRGCGQLKNKALQFKGVAHTFSSEARSFENTSASFSGESSKITDTKVLRIIQKHFKTTPTEKQLPQKFKDAIDALHQSIKSVVI